jgi:hypothetical protein
MHVKVYLGGSRFRNQHQQIFETLGDTTHRCSSSLPVSILEIYRGLGYALELVGPDKSPSSIQQDSTMRVRDRSLGLNTHPHFDSCSRQSDNLPFAICRLRSRCMASVSCLRPRAARCSSRNLISSSVLSCGRFPNISSSLRVVSARLGISDGASSYSSYWAPPGCPDGVNSKSPGKSEYDGMDGAVYCNSWWPAADCSCEAALVSRSGG